MDINVLPATVNEIQVGVLASFVVGQATVRLLAYDYERESKNNYQGSALVKVCFSPDVVEDSYHYALEVINRLVDSQEFSREIELDIDCDAMTVHRLSQTEWIVSLTYWGCDPEFEYLDSPLGTMEWATSRGISK